MCKNGSTDQDTVWVVEACIRWGAHWRHLANTIKSSMCVCDAAFLSNYFDHSFILCYTNVLVVIISQ